MYGRGISREGELLDLAVKLDVVQKKRRLVLFKGEQVKAQDN